MAAGCYDFTQTDATCICGTCLFVYGLTVSPWNMLLAAGLLVAMATNIFMVFRHLALKANA